jgi:5-methylthioadenosine/S-adenosylhomocysteine deaminase
MPRVLIKNGYVVTVNFDRDVWPNGFVVINGRNIESVGAGPAAPAGGFDRVLDASGMIVIPGLINTHQHLQYHLLKGVANGLLIEDFFPEVMIPLSRHLVDLDLEQSAYLAGIEMLTTGTTCCLHHLRVPSSEETLHLFTRPTIELGLRQVIGKDVQCRLPGNPNHPRNLDEEIAYIEDFIPRWKTAGDGLVRLCLVAECNALFMDQQVTSEALVVEAKRLADRYQLKISTHIAAGTLSFDKSYLQLLRKTGRSEVSMLMQLGVLDASYILAHSINCTSQDITMIADSGASVAYTPTSEAVRGGGLGPIAPMIEAGVNVALGTDGPAVDYSVDMVEQMKACSFLHNVKHLDPTIMPPERCLEMATINAARALGMEKEIGSLEPGKLADIAVFDLNTPRAAPANNPITSLVYSARGTDAHWVFVNGREVVREGVLTTFTDIPMLLEAVTRRSREIIHNANIADRAKPHWPKRNTNPDKQGETRA